MNKTCTVCGLPLPVEAFGFRHGKQHARAACRSCDNEYQRNYRMNNLEKTREVSRLAAKWAISTAEGREKVNANWRQLWQSGRYKERAQHYLNQLKETNFFKWKARKSYIWLTDGELKTLWENQKGRCALTGRLLDSTAELDHIIPKTRGGSNSLENAQWLCAPANQAKRNLLDGEFIALCREVIAWNDLQQPTMAHLRREQAV